MKIKLGQPVSILIVEDSHETVERARSEFGGSSITFDHAVNDAEALRMASRGSYDLILIDSLLPGSGGVELGVAMRKRPEFAATPIVLQTPVAWRDALSALA